MIGNFTVRVARIEMIESNERGEDIRLTFHIEGHQTSFNLRFVRRAVEAIEITR